jgi:hypothetical protein
MNFRVQIIFNFNSISNNVRKKIIDKKDVYFNESYVLVVTFITWTSITPDILWRTINLGRPVIGLTSKCEAGIMFN